MIVYHVNMLNLLKNKNIL